MMNGNDTGGLFGMPYELTLGLLIILLILLIGAAITLVRVRKQVQHITGTDDKHHTPRTTWFGRQWDYFNTTVNKTMFAMGIVGLLVLLGAIDLYTRAQDLGTQIGYAPEQPIKFNHKLHAGQYGIQCQYCHTGVEKGKQAGIPSISTCMNCHNYIKKGPQYGETEIKKVVAAYESKKPVKWVRIHNLPDHVMFNHAQHVKAGKLQCENCHGKVSTMERVQQVATLEMGWCVNCHREKTIDMSNPYYTGTYDFLQKDFVQKHKKYTIAQMGGLDCSKCHY